MGESSVGVSTCCCCCCVGGSPGCDCSGAGAGAGGLAGLGGFVTVVVGVSKIHHGLSGSLGALLFAPPSPFVLLPPPSSPRGPFLFPSTMPEGPLSSPPPRIPNTIPKMMSRRTTKHIDMRRNCLFFFSSLASRSSSSDNGTTADLLCFPSSSSLPSTEEISSLSLPFASPFILLFLLLPINLLKPKPELRKEPFPFCFCFCSPFSDFLLGSSTLGTAVLLYFGVLRIPLALGFGFLLVSSSSPLTSPILLLLLPLPSSSSPITVTLGLLYFGVLRMLLAFGAVFVSSSSPPLPSSPLSLSPLSSSFSPSSPFFASDSLAAPPFSSPSSSQSSSSFRENPSTVEIVVFPLDANVFMAEDAEEVFAEDETLRSSISPLAVLLLSRLLPVAKTTSRCLARGGDSERMTRPFSVATNPSGSIIFCVCFCCLLDV
mmetsp:Transcript_10340/g.22398  ORF Transcript_10340/g.22398 Transcript_10340/m.22398 type:complete len:431 (+) Transcript_10340:487-1779(+)